MRMSHRIRVYTMLVSIPLALLFLMMGVSPAAAQGTQEQHSQPRTWHVLVSIDNTNHDIMGMAFLPSHIWINEGDTVVWTANSAEPHTVTFLSKGQEEPKFDPNSPTQNLPQGSKVYDGHSYYNSGLISSMPGAFPGGTSYSLTFPNAGTFHYGCLLHPMMDGVVKVREEGTPYPYTQQQYDQKAQQQGNAILQDGNELAKEAGEHSNNHHVSVGADDGVAMVMRFFPSNVTIHVGDTITFKDRYPIDDPHTVSFGNVQEPFPPVTPIGDPRNFVGQTLNSGLLGTDTSWISRTVGNVYKVTYNKAGTYQFFCFIHFGMAINIVVK